MWYRSFLLLHSHRENAFLNIYIFLFQLFALSVKRTESIFWAFQRSHSGMTSVRVEHSKLILIAVYYMILTGMATKCPQHGSEDPLVQGFKTR